MQYLTFITALTALSTGVTGLALPLMTRDDCIDTPQYQSLKRNQSTVFGWQLAGSAKDSNEIDSYCTKLNNGGYTQWAQDGLSIDNIKKPICTATHTPTNATAALPNVVLANTKVFTTLLLNSFPATNKSAYTYLCDNLRFKQLEGFLLNDATIINATCNTGNALLSPQPFTPSASVNETAVDEFQTANAKLYAYIAASAACEEAELNLLCAHAPDYKGAWDTLRLNGSAVEETFCSIKAPLSAEEAKARVTEWTSRLFVSVLSNISNAAGYHEFLCQTLDVQGMNDVGMDGQLVKKLVCEDAQARAQRGEIS